MDFFRHRGGAIEMDFLDPLALTAFPIIPFMIAAGIAVHQSVKAISMPIDGL
jgi:hypothetical protein